MEKVYYNLNESEFVYKRNELEMYFSSKFKLESYSKKVDLYLESEKAKLRYKYRADVLFENVLLLNYYKIVEKKGFYAKYKGLELTQDYKIRAEIEV